MLWERKLGSHNSMGIQCQCLEIAMSVASPGGNRPDLHLGRGQGLSDFHLHLSLGLAWRGEAVLPSL